MVDAAPPPPVPADRPLPPPASCVPPQPLTGEGGPPQAVPLLPPPLPADEAGRLRALREFRILDTFPEPDFDDLARLAARICGTPIALVSMVDADRQWFKAKVGMEASETPREVAFCAHGILAEDLFVVPDAAADPRFASNPMVTGPPSIRFYAGVPLRTPGGHALGMLCVNDIVPRDLGAESRDALRALGRQTMRLLEDRRRALEERDSKRRCEDLLNSVDGIVWEADASDFRFTYVSRQCERILGYPPEEWMRGVTWDALVHPEDRDRTIATRSRATREMRNYIQEYRVLAADGRVVWVKDVATVISENERPVKVRGVLLDITKARISEDALRESELRFRQLAENIRGVFWMTDLEKNWMIYISPAYEEVWGRTRASLYAEPRAWLDAVHPEDRERVVKAAVTKQATGEYDETYRIVRPDGSIRWIRDRAFPVRDGSPKVLRVAGVAEDITETMRCRAERERLEAELRQIQKLEAVGQLAGGVAHELNNPLQAIIAYSSVLEQKMIGAIARVPEAEKCRKTVQAIQEAAGRSAKIVRGLLSFARKDGIAITTVDLNDLARSTAELLDHTMGLQSVAIHLDLGPGQLTVRGNPVALQQALTNLLLNAKDAMPRGGTVTLRTRRGNGSVEIAVADAGTGMTPSVKARLFEPFFTTKPPGKGTGLGLSITYGIVQEHGGSIRVESAPGNGSTFALRFPAMERAGTSGAAGPGIPPSPGGPAGAAAAPPVPPSEVRS